MAAKTASKKTLRWTVDISAAVEDGVVVPSDFVKYLSEHIKVNGKAGALGDVVKVTADGNKIVIASTSSFSKRYFKYLTKKYLQKNEIRDFIRVIATTKYGYELRFLNLAGAEEDAE